MGEVTVYTDGSFVNGHVASATWGAVVLSHLGFNQMGGILGAGYHNSIDTEFGAIRAALKEAAAYDRIRNGDVVDVRTDAYDSWRFLTRQRKPFASINERDMATIEALVAENDIKLLAHWIPKYGQNHADKKYHLICHKRASYERNRRRRIFA